MTGWIKLHRSLQDCDLWTDKEPFDRRSAWVDLLMMANHEDKQIVINGEPVTITRGQRFTSTIKLSERWHWSVNRVRRYLALLERLQMVTTNRTTNGITITIVKYGFFQDTQTTDGITNGITNGIGVGITNGITDGIQTRIKKNEKNEKNDKEKKNTYGEYRHVRLTDRERDRLFNDYGEADTLAAIKHLDEYMQMTGKTYKDHNLALRKWVFDAVKEKQAKKPKQDNIMDWLKA